MRQRLLLPVLLLLALLPFLLAARSTAQDADPFQPAATEGTSTVGGRVSPDGAEEITVDIPAALHMRNTGGMGRGGPGTGSGLCVFTSIEICGHWQQMRSLYGLQKYMTTRAGGGYPSKVDQVLASFAPDVPYVQYEGTDPAIIKLALKTRRAVGMTYGYSPRYQAQGGSGLVSHMVTGVHLSEKWGCVLDNNFPGESTYEWMPAAEFLRRWRLDANGRVGSGWVCIPLGPAPMPAPQTTPAKKAG